MGIIVDVIVSYISDMSESLGRRMARSRSRWCLVQVSHIPSTHSSTVSLSFVRVFVTPFSVNWKFQNGLRYLNWYCSSHNEHVHVRKCEQSWQEFILRDVIVRNCVCVTTDDTLNRCSKSFYRRMTIYLLLAKQFYFFQKFCIHFFILLILLLFENIFPLTPYFPHFSHLFICTRLHSFSFVWSLFDALIKTVKCIYQRVRFVNREQRHLLKIGAEGNVNGVVCVSRSFRWFWKYSE